MTWVKLKILGVYCGLSIAVAGCEHEKAFNGPPICTEVYSDKVIPPWENNFISAAPKALVWPTVRGKALILTVKFFNGSPFQQSCVREFAQEWINASSLIENTNTHKIQFEFLDKDSPDSADIRIRFTGSISQSRVGRDCLNLGQDAATTLIGYIDRAYNWKVRRAMVLHELGHTLGLVHEHQNPDSAIPWDSSKVYAYYMDKRYEDPPWDSIEVERNIFYRYARNEVNWLKFDEDSIMCYSFAAPLIKAQTSTPWNNDLSSQDIAFIKILYSDLPSGPFGIYAPETLP
ncbi:hypothetical protein [Mucilaginibacter aquaedulcis]|uniref:hypothetical protein n=1 Tax=Mucilaginibacter aquaedulcis TaxID=1187081 RepID=UPI0025B55C10|nr:hypothetical protein [Mucilaginibacter aquaedulcis]MDN3548903.1 hypothetical protein [Mucilaginibacter aquaedulcis]